jgi:hypothetical protein
LAQTPTPTVVPTTTAPTAVDSTTTVSTNTDPGAFLTSFGNQLGAILPSLLGALGILVLGWLIAALVSSAVRGLLKRTDVDRRLANAVTGRPAQASDTQIEGWASTLVFWIIMILAIVAALNVLNLTTVSQPLNNFLNEIFAYLPRVGAAAIWLGVAWILATLAKAAVVRISRSFGLDERLQTTPANADPLAVQSSPFLLSETLGNALYWFVFLFFLPLILGVLNLQGPLLPVQNLLDQILSALPNILKAVLIGVVGWFLAGIVRNIVTNLLAAVGTDRIGARVGLSRTTGGQSLSWILGTIVYVLILIPTAIAALDALRIPAISVPATSMLNQILSAIPQIFTAALILIAGYAVGRFVGDLVSNILAGIGFNNIFQWLGLQSIPYPRREPVSAYQSEFSTGEPPLVQESDMTPIRVTRTPSEIAGVVVLIGILLFATVAATNVLNFPALTAIVTGLLVIFGRILSGLVVFAVGLYLANLAFSLITSSGNPQAQLLGQTARIAIIALVAAMALQQMGIAPSIVNLAFGLLLGAIAVAIAIAFGLGGRDVAGEQLRGWLNEFKRR